MKRLLLVYPKSYAARLAGFQHISDLYHRDGYMNCSLPTIAALTPPGFKVEIVDENRQEIDYDRDYDLVGLTGYQFELDQARSIAGRFRERGVPVVSGGPGASLSPQKWRPFSDVLVLGEAERTWEVFLRDFLAGDYRDEYKDEEWIDMGISPVPDYRGIPARLRRSYVAGIVQTSRGCPFDCEFCSVVLHVGRQMRYKPVERVVAEVEQLKRLGLGIVLLADDNFAAGRKEAKEILRVLRDWNRRQRNPVMFLTQLSIDTAQDEELLELASEAGLNRVVIGIETPNVESLKEAHKAHNVRSNLLEDVRTFHEHGIAAHATMILGFDHDDLEIFQRHFDFLTAAGIMNARPYPIQAHDGTRLKKRMVAEGRYLEEPVTSGPFTQSMYSTFTMRPKQMTVDQLRQGLYWLIWELHKPHNVEQRAAKFFADFEASPKKKKLRIPRRRGGWEGLKSFWRIVRYYRRQAPQAEREALEKLYFLAQQSSHPQARNIAIGQFLEMKMHHGMMRMLDDEIENIRYPTAQPG